jgi:hypothetical protein
MAATEELSSSRLRRCGHSQPRNSAGGLVELARDAGHVVR